MKKPLIALSIVLCTAVSARLPAPEPTPEAQAKAAEAAARTAWSGKVDAYKLCMAQDRVAASYRAHAAAAGKPAPAAVPTPPCTDPGPFAYHAEPPKPLEASGAHSPAPTAVAPPSTPVPAAQANPTPKKK